MHLSSTQAPGRIVLLLYSDIRKSLRGIGLFRTSSLTCSGDEVYDFCPLYGGLGHRGTCPKVVVVWMRAHHKDNPSFKVYLIHISSPIIFLSKSARFLFR